MKLEKKVVSHSISSQVYQLLKENIINLTLEPGTAISEKEISDRLEVSRTPVREAFVRLVQDDLLEVYPQKGTRVSLIDLKEVADARFIREHLEKATYELVCLKIKDLQIQELKENIEQQMKSVTEQRFADFFKWDEAFHHLIVEISGNQKIWPAIQRVDAHLKRIRVLSLINEEKSQVIIQEHIHLLQALENRDAVKAIHLLEDHVNQLTKEEETLKQQRPHYFSISS